MSLKVPGLTPPNGQDSTHLGSMSVPAVCTERLICVFYLLRGCVRTTMSPGVQYGVRFRKVRYAFEAKERAGTRMLGYTSAVDEPHMCVFLGEGSCSSQCLDLQQSNHASSKRNSLFIIEIFSPPLEIYPSIQISPFTACTEGVHGIARQAPK